MRLLVLMTAAGFAAASAAPSPGVEVIEHRLDNGLLIILAPQPSKGVAFARMFHNEGSAHDPPGLAGMAHFFEHLLFEGTARIGTWDWEGEREILDRIFEIESALEAERDRLAQEQPHRSVSEIEHLDFPLSEPLVGSSPRLLELQSELDRLLAERVRYNRPLDVNASYYYWGDSVSFARTGVDATYYESVLPAAYLEAFFWIESDKFRPVFRNFQVARDTVQEQVLRFTLGPDSAFDRQMDEVFFGSSFGRYSGGGYELEQATPLDAKRFAELYLTPNNSHLVIAGDFDIDAVKALGEKYFGPLPRGAPPPRLKVLEPSPLGEKRLTLEGEGRPRIEIRVPIPGGEPATGAAIDLLVESLDGPRGLLSEAFRDGELVASSGASRHSTRYWGYIAIEASPRETASLPEVERRTIELLEGLGREPVEPAVLDRARRRLEARYARLVHDPNAFCLELGRQQTRSLWRDVLTRPERWSRVDAGELARVARELFRPERRTTGVYLHR